MSIGKLWSRCISASAPLTDPNQPAGRTEALSELLPGLITIFITGMLVATVPSSFIDSMLEDGSVKHNARWAHLAEAYDFIGKNPDQDIIVIGSSRMYSGLDASCLDSKDETSSHWNLAVRGDFPYLRLPEIDSLVGANAEVVIIEVGPNTLSSGIGTREDRLRWEVASMNFQWHGDETWWSQIRDEDRPYLARSSLDVHLTRRTFSPEAADELSHRIIFRESRAMEYRDGMMPLPMGSDEWVQAVKDPPRNPPNILSDEEMSSTINQLINSPFFHPSSADHANRLALEHIIESLKSNGTDVILYGPAVHPDFLTQLPDGTWDEYNLSIDTLTEDGWTHYDRTFERWDEEHFNDPVHFSKIGRSAICTDIASIIANEIRG